jgi:hypothetical protein
VVLIYATIFCSIVSPSRSISHRNRSTTTHPCIPLNSFTSTVAILFLAARIQYVTPWRGEKNNCVRSYPMDHGRELAFSHSQPPIPSMSLSTAGLISNLFMVQPRNFIPIELRSLFWYFWRVIYSLKNAPQHSLRLPKPICHHQ